MTSQEKVVLLTEKVPRDRYEEVALMSLAPCQRRVKFSARVVNIHDQVLSHKPRKAAKGCLKILVQDCGAALLVNLWYRDEAYDSLHLGSLVTIWTTHISSTGSSIAVDVHHIQPAGILTSMFPERDVGCYIQIHQPNDQKNLYRTPLTYLPGRGIEGLLSLRSFVDAAGHETAEAKLLVYVKAVGRPAPYTSPNPKLNGANTVINIGIADAEDSETEAILSFLTPHLIQTALMDFIPYETVLLISYPTWRTGHRISISARTQIDVDPSIPEAKVLRKWAQRWNRPANELVDDSVEVFRDILPPKAPPPLRHSLASFSRSVQDNPDSLHISYLPVILSSVNLISLIQHKQLFCMPCLESRYRPHHSSVHLCPSTPSQQTLPSRCPSKSPLYGLHPSTSTLLTPTPHVCPSCQTSPITLRMNPSVVGHLHDETGTLSTTLPSILSRPSPSESNTKQQCHKSHPRGVPPLLWTDKAYTSLLGRPPSEIGRLALLASSHISSKHTVDPSKGSDPNPTASHHHPHQNATGESKEAYDFLQYIEHRLQWMRIILLVGWTGSMSGHGPGSGPRSRSTTATATSHEGDIQDRHMAGSVQDVTDHGHGGEGQELIAKEAEKARKQAVEQIEDHQEGEDQTDNVEEEGEEEGRLIVLDVVG